MEIKKVIFGISAGILLSGCVQSSAMLGPAITIASTGNVSQAGLTFITNKCQAWPLTNSGRIRPSILSNPWIYLFTISNRRFWCYFDGHFPVYILNFKDPALYKMVAKQMITNAKNRGHNIAFAVLKY